MFKLFQSIFGGSEVQGLVLPPGLLDAAIDRALEATDPRIRAVSGHRKRLEPAVRHAIEHVVALVAGLPEPVEASARAYGDDARLASFFASPERMAEVFGADRALIEYLEGAEDTGADPIHAVLFVERSERKVLGIAEQGGQVLHDVAQVQVSFDKHRLVAPSASLAELQKALRHRAFDHLLAMALARIAEAGSEREALEASQSVLRSKLRALKSAHMGFAEEGGEKSDPAALEARLAEIEGKLEATGAGTKVLPRHLELLADTLLQSERQLYVEPVTILMDRMGIRQASAGGTTVELPLRELHDGVGACVVSLPVTIPRREIRRRDVFADIQKALL